MAMRIAVHLSFNEGAAVRLLNWLARENAQILAQQPDLPGLYDAGVVYGRERAEVWCDWIQMLRRGWEDCDGLSAARAGELLARGSAAIDERDQDAWRVSRFPPHEGDAFRVARRLEQRLGGPVPVYAEVVLRTRTRKGAPGLFHCIVRYQFLLDEHRRSRWFRDDPSARLGMYDRAAPERALTATRRNR